jgi:Fic family protein
MPDGSESRISPKILGIWVTVIVVFIGFIGAGVNNALSTWREIGALWTEKEKVLAEVMQHKDAIRQHTSDLRLMTRDVSSMRHDVGQIEVQTQASLDDIKEVKVNMKAGFNRLEKLIKENGRGGG